MCSNKFKKENELGLSQYIYIRSRWEKSLAFSSSAAAAKSLQSCPTLCDPTDGSPPRIPRPWDSPCKNTGVSCHFLLQCMKVKSESEVTQSCLTPSNPMDYSLPGSSTHGIFQAKVLEWGAIAFFVNVCICVYMYVCIYIYTYTTSSLPIYLLMDS